MGGECGGEGGVWGIGSPGVWERAWGGRGREGEGGAEGRGGTEVWRGRRAGAGGGVFKSPRRTSKSPPKIKRKAAKEKPIKKEGLEKREGEGAGVAAPRELWRWEEGVGTGVCGRLTGEGREVSEKARGERSVEKVAEGTKGGAEGARSSQKARAEAGRSAGFLAREERIAASMGAGTSRAGIVEVKGKGGWER